MQMMLFLEEGMVNSAEIIVCVIHIIWMIEKVMTMPTEYENVKYLIELNTTTIWNLKK